MAFFRNSSVNLLNTHYGVRSLALSLGGAYYGVFLLRSGVPAPVVLSAMALVLAGRFGIRPFILKAATRWGLKPLVVAGTLLSGLQYPLLAEVHGVDWPLLLLCAISAMGDAVYWTAYHAYFAAMGDAEHRGHQIAARQAIAGVIGVVGPLLGGWALATAGPQVAFGVAAAVMALAALPILGMRNVMVGKAVPGAVHAARPGMLIFAADGWISAGLYTVWPIALFVSLGKSFTAFGGAVALASLAGALGGLLLGRFIDAGHGGRAVWMAAGALVFTIGLRAAGCGHPVLAIVANAAGALVSALYVPTLMTAMYNSAKASPCMLRFNIATEGGWDAGSAAGCLIAAVVLWAGASMSAAILLSLFGVAANVVLLRLYYDRAVPQAAMTAA
jgi:MFS family permease